MENLQLKNDVNPKVFCFLECFYQGLILLKNKLVHHCVTSKGEIVKKDK